MDELISVVIPAFNVGMYLTNCLNSVLQQSYSAIEIVLVDDGSTDNTPQIVDHYQALYPDRVFIIHTKNQGVTMARLEGIKAAKGEWIGFVDGDDEIEPDMYERLYKNAIKYHADISHCGYRIIVNGGAQIYDFYNTGNLVKQDRNTGLAGLLSGSFEPSLCTKIFRKELLSSLLSKGLMDTTIKYNEDVLMNFYLFRNAECSIYEDFCGYHYLSRETSATRRGFCIEKVMDPIKVSSQILKCATNDFKELAWKRYFKACISAYASLVNKEKYREEAEYCRERLLVNKKHWRFMRRNDRIKMRMLLLSPQFYKCFYLFYRKFIQKKKYY